MKNGWEVLKMRARAILRSTELGGEKLGEKKNKQHKGEHLHDRPCLILSISSVVDGQGRTWFSVSVRIDSPLQEFCTNEL